MKVINKNIPLILILENVERYIDTLNHFKNKLLHLKKNYESFETKQEVILEIENCLQDNFFEKTICDLDEYLAFYKEKFDYQIFLKFKLKKLFETHITYDDYPYLWELSCDWEELFELQQLPFNEIFKLDYFLKINNLVFKTQKKINVISYKAYITEKTINEILTRLLNFLIQRLAIDLFLIKYELDDTLCQFEHNVLYGIGSNTNRILNESPKSFFYKYWKDRNKGTIAMQKAFEELVKNNFISADNTYRDFSNLFRGKTITKPIIWCGLKSDLSHFIRLLHSTHNVIEKRSKDLYKITRKLFISSDGFEFETEKFKDDKPTKKEKILNEIVKELKGNEK